MPTRVVKDWLSEYKALSEVEVNTFASTVRQNEELVDALHDMLEDEGSQEMLDPVCHQLFEFYRCGVPDLQRFTIETLPVMIEAYLCALTRNDKKKCSAIEACLLGVYNLEVVGPDGKPKVKTFTIPTLAVPSVYHEPPSLATLALTESALLRYHSEEHVQISVGPFPQVDRINSQNRMSTITYLMSHFNSDISNLSPRSHYALCKVSSKLVVMGFDMCQGGAEDGEGVDLNESISSQSSRSSRRGVQFVVEPRIHFSSGFLIELLGGVYYAMFNGQAQEGIQAVKDVHKRASYELYADVLLVTNAILNSLQYNPSGQPKDGPMGISIALSPSQGMAGFSKSAITNASFRTKKLPEDIDVPEDGKQPGSATGDKPPKYDEVVITPAATQTLTSAPTPSTDPDKPDKSTTKPDKSTKLSKPLKSIMKKTSSGSEKQEKAPKSSKKDAEAIKRDRKSASVILGMTSGNDSIESNSPKNPKHSISMTTGLGMSSHNGVAGDLADPTMVGVQVIRSSSSATGRTFQTAEYADLRAGGAGVLTTKISSMSEDSVQSRGQSREVSSSSTLEDRDPVDHKKLTDESLETVDTQL